MINFVIETEVGIGIISPLSLEFPAIDSTLRFEVLTSVQFDIPFDLHRYPESTNVKLSKRFGFLQIVGQSFDSTR